MVRREQAVRRLRERVDLGDSSINSGDIKLKEWGKRLFSSPGHVSPAASQTAHEASTGTRAKPETESEAVAAEVDGAAGSKAARSPVGAKKAKPRKSHPRALRLLPTHHEETGQKETATAGRSSPSSFARERIRQIAAKNAPFDDPDQQRPQCKWLPHIFVPPCGGVCC